MHKAANPQPQNSNGTTTPHHVPPADSSALAAKKTVAMLLNPTEAPAFTKTDVPQLVNEAAQNAANKEQIAARMTARFNPGVASQDPQTVARVQPNNQPEPAEPIVVEDPSPGVAVSPEPVSDSDTEFQVSPEDELNPKAENFKKVRQALSQTKKTAKQLQEERDILTEKLKKYETDEVLTPAGIKFKARVAELEPLEHILNLKKSEAYNEKYVKPLNELNAKLKEIATDYSVPEDVLDQASKLTNQRELNSFLEENFGSVGGLEVKQVIKDLQRVRGDLAQAEAEPSKALERITQEHEQLKHNEEVNRRAKIVETSKSSWTNAVMSIREEGKIAELIPRSDDPEFNSTWVDPITKKAAEHYGKCMSYLGERGLQEIDPQFAKDLATNSLLATVASTAIARANAAEAELRELQQNLPRMNAMLRPGVRNSGGAGAPTQTAKPSSPVETARALLRQQGVRI